MLLATDLQSGAGPYCYRQRYPLHPMHEPGVTRPTDLSLPKQMAAPIGDGELVA